MERLSADLTKLEEIMARLNPWLVESIEAFSFYCCPECQFRSNEAIFFQAHALQNHDLSKSLFEFKQESFDNGLPDNLKVDIKLEPVETEPENDLLDYEEDYNATNSAR